MTRHDLPDRADIGIEILVDGFFDNPVMAWVFRDESTRAEALEAWFRFWVNLYGPHGLIDVNEDGDGAALWATPDTPPLGGDGFAALIDIVRTHNGERTGVVLEGFAAVHPPKQRHWYLNSIAARRGQRARGVGARLLEPFVARADAEGVPIYLESSNERNLTFYRRYGFDDFAARIDLPDAGPSMQPMLRPCPGS